MKFYAYLSLIVSYPVFSQTDTMYLDPTTGNYVIQYMGITQDGVDSMIVFSYEPLTKIDPIINSYVERVNDSQYLYRYKITNGPQAKQNLNEFSLHFGKGVSIESRTPATSWDNRRPKNFLPDTGFADRWVWHGHQGLEPTWLIDNCIIVSDGLPSITDSYSQAKRRILIWPADQKDNSQIDISSKLLRLRAYPNDNVLRKTIGPKLPPSPFIAIIFLDTLLSYTRQSVQLGWLKTTRDDDCDEDEQPNDGITRNIEKRIEKAKKELMKGDSLKARKELEKLVKKVERIYKKSEEAERKKREGGIAMTSEAYALLKYNAEYLIERLPEKNRKKQ